MQNKIKFSAAIAALALSASAQAIVAPTTGVYITEWMYSGSDEEFVELTNLSGSTVDFAGWSYDDDSRLPGTFDLSGFGLVAPGESVIFTESNAAIFRLAWGLDASVKVLGDVSNNLGRNDEINIYGAFDGATFPVVDLLTYGDEDFPGSPRTKDISANPMSMAALGANDPTQWVSSAVGDAFGSWTSLSGDVGNPGSYSAVPVPAAAWLFGSALFGLLGLRRRATA